MQDWQRDLTGYKIDIKASQAIESGELPENYMELMEGVYERRDVRGQLMKRCLNEAYETSEEASERQHRKDEIQFEEMKE